jgi:16S rRNA (guanine527-N7)-methyltransferase
MESRAGFRRRLNVVNAVAIREAFDSAGIAELPGAVYDQLSDYLELLLRWNARFSLTSIKDPRQIIRRHLVECAFAAQYLPVGVQTLLDFGSGAGLPGLIFAICRPEIRVTLAEAQAKKASFLLEALRTVGSRSEVYNGRVENLPEARTFDVVSMRAVERMEVAIPAAIKRVGKYLVLFTTEKSMPDFQRLSEELEWLPAISLPNSEQIILAIGAVGKTPPI